MCFICSILMIAAGIPSMAEWLLYPGLMTFIVGLLQAVVFYRCPKCHYPLMKKRGKIPDQCTSCGLRLKDYD